MPLQPVYDRALLLLGLKRNEVLTLEEVRQYGVDSFSDPDYVQIYEKLVSTSLREVRALLDWSDLCIYDLNDVGKNYGILLGTMGWKP